MVTAVAASSTYNGSDNKDNTDAKNKKNRCARCHKKDGLTIFECRCGGLFRAIGRYSDKNDCGLIYQENGSQ